MATHFEKFFKVRFWDRIDALGIFFFKVRCNIAVYVALVSIDQDIIHANVNRKSTGRSSMYDMKSLMTRIKVVFYFDI